MKKKISFVCPTYKRKEMQKRLVNSILSSATRPEDIEIVFGIDDDDEIAIEAYEELRHKYGEDFIKICLVPSGENLANISNLCAMNVASGEIIGQIADDVVMEAPGWDTLVLEEFAKYEDGILLLWSDDGIWGGSLASHYFIHRNWIKVSGYVQPTFFHADWTDHWNQTLSTRLGRSVCIRDRSKLFLRHLHAEHGGMQKDETYWRVKERRERNVKEGLTFHKPTPEMEKAFGEQLNKLKDYIEQYHEGQK